MRKVLFVLPILLFWNSAFAGPIFIYPTYGQADCGTESQLEALLYTGGDTAVHALAAASEDVFDKYTYGAVISQLKSEPARYRTDMIQKGCASTVAVKPIQAASPKVPFGAAGNKFAGLSAQ